MKKKKSRKEFLKKAERKRKRKDKAKIEDSDKA